MNSRIFGINVIGFITGNLGLGVAARSIVEGLLTKGVQIRLFDLDPGLGRKKFDTKYSHLISENLRELVHPVNLFILSPTSFSTELITQFSGEPRLNVAYAPWELSQLPRVLKDCLNQLDVVVGCSRFVFDAFGRDLDGPRVIYGALPSDIGAVSPVKRQDRAAGIRFVSCFEPHSDIARKNPFGAIDAYKLAFPSLDDATTLTIKINNGVSPDGRFHPAIVELVQRIGNHPGINLNFERMERHELFEFFSQFDVGISLHRAEGFGLVPLELMSLGIPVLSTNWSGTTDYLNHDNSFPVKYSMAPINATVSAYQAEHYEHPVKWAEPSVDDAALIMRRLATDRDILEKYSSAARAGAEKYITSAKKMNFVDEIEAIHNHFPKH